MLHHACRLVAMFCLALVALAWSAGARAQTCDFVAIGPTTQIGLAGTNLTFTIEAQTACAATVDVTLAITPGETTGGASIVPPTNPVLTLDTPYDFTLTLGPNGGGAGTVTATCTSGGCAGDTLVFNFSTNNEFVYVASGPANVVTNQISTFDLATSLQLNGAPGTLSTSFANLTVPTTPTIVAPVGGVATLTGQSIVTAGTYNFSGSLQCPTIFVLEGCASVPPVLFTVDVEPVSLTAVTPLAPSTPAGTPLAMTVAYGSPSLPAPDGTAIFWSITAEPPGGDGAITSPATAGGQSTASFSATVPGVYTVFANSGCTFCAVSSQTFNVTVNAVPTLSITGGNGQASDVGTPFAAPLAVLAEDSGTPAVGVGITWTVTAGAATVVPSGATDGTGAASATVTPTAAGPVTITATRDDAPAVTVTFNLNATAVPSLAVVSGDGQNTLAGTTFAQPLVVIAEDSGVPATGVGITWAVTGDATLVPGGATDANGQASAVVTAGATAGPLVITATRQDAPAATTTFNLAVEALGSLVIVSGDDQTLAANVASAPLVVELKNAAGVPVVGATVSWTASAGALASATSVTDAAGQASNTVTVAVPGPVEVTASSPLADAPAVFGLKGALENLTGLNSTQRRIAEVLDQACPALSALATPSPEQQDLLARCLELYDATAIDPAAVVVAIDQLMAEVALVQGNAGMAAAQAQFQNLKTRIAALRSGTNGTSFGGLAINTRQGPLSLGLLATAMSEGQNPAEIGADFSRWGFFAAGTIGRAEAEAGLVDPAYDLDVEGLTAGVDYRWSDRWVFGGSLGMTRQDTGLPGERGSLETSGWSVSAYTTWYKPDSWYVDGVLTWGRNDYEMLRRIQYTLPLAGGGSTSIDQRARSDSKGDLLSAAFTFGRDFNRGGWGFGPYGRLLYTRLDFDEINETLDAGPGSGLGLQIRSRQLDSLASVLGGKLTYTHSAAWGVLMPHLQLEWEHEFRDDPQALEARFLHDPTGATVLLSGDPLDTDYFRLGLGMSMVLTEGRSGFFYYERLMGRDRTSQYNLALGLRMEF